MRSHFQALDGFRGVAALAVVWIHTTQILDLPFKPHMAFMAVDFFFCLSGFVIAYAYEEKLRSSMSFRTFMIERLIRLMPIAATGAVLGGAVLLVRALVLRDLPVDRVLLTTFLNALLIPSGTLLDRRHAEAFPVNPVLWSLFFEILINGIFAICVFHLNKTALTIAAVLGAVLVLLVGLEWGTLDVGHNWSDLIAGFSRVLYPFSMGALIYKLRLAPSHKQDLSASIHDLSFPARPRESEVTGPGLGFYAGGSANGGRRTKALTLPLALCLAISLVGPFAGLSAEFLTALLVFPVIVYAGAGAAPNRWVRVACARLGALSYPLYAVNHPLIRLIKFAALRIHHAPPVAVAALSMGLPIAVATMLIPIDARFRAYLKATLLPVPSRPVVAPPYSAQP